MVLWVGSESPEGWGPEVIAPIGVPKEYWTRQDGPPEPGDITRPGIAPASDITWNVDVPGKENAPYFLGLTGSYGKEMHVIEFRISGHNNMDTPIERFGGYVRSDTTNKRIPIGFMINGTLIPSDKTNGIPRKSDFIVSSLQFDQEHVGQGMPTSQFLTEFPSFTFVFEYDGKKLQRHFSKDEIRQVIQRVEDDFAAANGSTKPRVTLK
jgi:hypothetical protein